MGHTPGPWALELNNHPNEIGDHNYSLFHNGWEFGKYNDESLACGFEPDTPAANARLIAAAPAYKMAWDLVPDEIKQRIFDALHRPDTEWVEAAIFRVE